jgi:F0F1-type ATP synthase assembly protein I
LPGPAPIVRYARYGAAAFEFSGTIGAGAFIGWLLDRWLHTEPYMLVFSTLAAVVGGFVRLIQVLRQFERVDHLDPQP